MHLIAKYFFNLQAKIEMLNIITIIMSTRNTLDCDQSNVYSSRTDFSAISLLKLFFVPPLYVVGRLVTLPHEISFESPSL